MLYVNDDMITTDIYLLRHVLNRESLSDAELKRDPAQDIFH